MRKLAVFAISISLWFALLRFNTYWFTGLAAFGPFATYLDCLNTAYRISLYTGGTFIDCRYELDL